MDHSIARSVGVGSCVTVRDLHTHDEFDLIIVPQRDPSEPEHIAPASPVAQALLGAHVHDVVSWPTPRGESRFCITAICPEVQS